MYYSLDHMIQYAYFIWFSQSLKDYVVVDVVNEIFQQSNPSIAVIGERKNIIFESANVAYYSERNPFSGNDFSFPLGDLG